ncbi:ATP-binding protein [Sporofaciens musculi]|jgi:predicted AAA+ superfamily ATPase|uniref:ATP-binding protein n=2 Tax=Sporofaciens musculi TaxID=2681861 RepID=UPI0025A0FE18|nr:ATP-binding protein [Sporofaciens musculi]
MYRRLIEHLKSWKESQNRKPMILRGARQVGKTWLMKEFGRTCYKKCAYISMDENEVMEEVFRDAFDISRIITALEIAVGFQIEPGNTLIIFDEVQEIPRALKALKYFCENAPEYHVIAAGSLLGVALHEGTSFPVGKVEFCDLYPMDFWEFLKACGEDGLADLLAARDYGLISDFKNKYMDYLKYYYYVGGMPEVVSVFSEERDMKQVRVIQKRLLAAYENDFSKHAPKEVVTRIRMLWNSVPTQLAKENKKFIYGLIRDGARAREYEVAITWLIDCGLVYKINRVSKPGFPLRAYQDFKAFKLFVLDIGLLGAMSGLNAKIILEKSRLFEEFKGALTEQYVMQQLVVNPENDLFYWSSENGTAEIDFLLQNEEGIIPVEVKAQENLQAKSLKLFCEKYHPNLAVRTSMSDYREQDWMVNIPLYLVGRDFL